MKISTLSIDLAKHVFQVLGMDSTGKSVLSKRLSRDKLTILLHQTPQYQASPGQPTTEKGYVHATN